MSVSTQCQSHPLVDVPITYLKTLSAQSFTVKINGAVVPTLVFFELFKCLPDEFGFIELTDGEIGAAPRAPLEVHEN